MGAFSDTMEVASSWSNLGQLYDNVRKALSPHAIVMAHLSHAYPDGCSIYFTFAGSAKDDAAASELYDRAWRDGLTAVLASGATLSHHHGIGRSKAPRLGEEIGEGVGLVRELMAAWDPGHVMNPGNLLPTKTPAVAGGVSESPIRPTKQNVDEHSLLATFDGNTRVADAEKTLRDRGLTLAAEPLPSGATIGTWIGEGMPGASDRWLDPVDQHIAGFSARLKNGSDMVIRPSPRRAVGPDLTALFHGTAGAVGDVTSATLRVRRADAAAARELPFAGERDPGLSDGEQVAWERAVAALTRA
jgi:alkyldihydroxyacetonephosphate synthase